MFVSRQNTTKKHQNILNEDLDNVKTQQID